MNSYPETKTFFILGNLCPFTRAESFLPNLKLNTEHLNLFSVALEWLSYDNFLPQADLGGKKTKKTQQKEFKALSKHGVVYILLPVLKAVTLE